MKKKETRGGYRANAKRPLKYGEPTIVLHFRAPESQAEAVKKIVNNFLNKYLENVTRIQNSRIFTYQLTRRRNQPKGETQ